MNSAIYVGAIAHTRYIPKPHSFSYPFFMWFVDLDKLAVLPSLGRYFSTTRWAFNRLHRPDYLGDPDVPLAAAVRRRMAELTGRTVEGQVFGLMNARSLGLYFSPVNFYYGFDSSGGLSHFLAEVSNIPWNERHQYGHYVAGGENRPSHPKAFHVSPFNPREQHYTWKIEPPGEELVIQLGVHDGRGHIFDADLRLHRKPYCLAEARKQFLKKPVMTAFIVAGIYWQALKIYLKGIPYIPYKKERA